MSNSTKAGARLVIGLTGGIGTGKSTVSAYLRQKGYPVIDADVISREVVKPGSTLLTELSEVFGRDIINPEGELDRKKLGSIVFSSPAQRQKLDDIMMSSILNEIKHRIETLSSQDNYSIIFVDAALIMESGLDSEMDLIWVVDASDDVRIDRIILRDCMSIEEIENRIASQMDREEKLARADFVLDNSGSEDELYVQVDRLLRENGIR